MDKIVYVYGSARDAATRSLRRGAVPRQQQVRLGPWIIRPARRTAVDFAQLAKFERDVLEKIQQGLIQVQNGDEVVYSREELKAAFDALKSPGGAIDFATMPIAELYELMRAEKPSQDVWDIFVQRSLTEEDPSFPPLDERLSSLERYAVRLGQGGLSMLKANVVFDATRQKLAAQRAAADAQVVQAEAEQAAENARKAVEAVEQVQATEQAIAAVEAVERAADPEQMDFTAPEAAEPSSTPEVTEQPSEPATEVAPAPEQDPRAARLAQLPEGWKGLTNAKLVEMMSGLGIEVPERQNKASLTAAVEKWVEGS